MRKYFGSVGNGFFYKWKKGRFSYGEINSAVQ